MLCGRKGWKKVESRSWAPAGSARSLEPGKPALPAPNLPPGKGVKSGLAFPGLFWYNHKESAEPGQANDHDKAIIDRYHARSEHKRRNPLRYPD